MKSGLAKAELWNENVCSIVSFLLHDAVLCVVCTSASLPKLLCSVDGNTIFFNEGALFEFLDKTPSESC